MKSTTIIAGSLVAASHFLSALALIPDTVPIAPNKVQRAEQGKQSPVGVPEQGAITSVGCFKSNANMTETKTKARVSSGNCREACEAKGFTVLSLQLTHCYCGDMMPPESDLVPDKNCDYACPGYGDEACGSRGDPGHFSIFNLGVDVDPPVYEPPEEDKEEESATSTAAGPSSTAPNPGAEETAAESEAPESEENGGGSPNVAGIAAGSVAGVVAVVAAAGGLFFFMRRRRNTEIEEEHRRNAAVNAFISGSKPPGSSGSISMTDSRLDPVMAHRRLSDGSIADNEDYSRKILRVTNA